MTSSLPSFILFLALHISVLSVLAQRPTVVGPQGEAFVVRTVACQLSDPWEVSYGPDGWLWMTESKGYKVRRIDPATGKNVMLLDLTSERHFPRYDKMGDKNTKKPWPQGGLMGMALHPDLLKGMPYVYLVYVWKFEGADSAGSGCKPGFGGCFFKGRVVRYKYQASSQRLVEPVVMCDSIPQSSDHNGGRLVVAPVDGKDYLFYSIGDMGAGQFDNGGRTNHAQEAMSYEGKILRFNTVPDGDTVVSDKWIPNDNPFNGQVQNAVWSVGHRNPQGLAYAVVDGVGRLYSSEHGPYSDDEVNLIEKGKNYGHPLIIGYADGNYNGLAASVSNHDSLPGRWHTSYPLITNERSNMQAIGLSSYRDPLITLYPNSRDFLQGLFDSVSATGARVKWPSEAPSSIDIYTSDGIPGWKNSVLLSTLKGGKLIRLRLGKDGSSIVGDTLCYFKGRQRFRDLAISSDGRKLYMATDSAAVSSGPSRKNPKEVSYEGCIIEYKYIRSAMKKP